MERTSRRRIGVVTTAASIATLLGAPPSTAVHDGDGSVPARSPVYDRVRDAAGLGSPFELLATGDGDVDLTLTGSAAGASGDCVQSVTATAVGLLVRLSLADEPCPVAVG